MAENEPRRMRGPCEFLSDTFIGTFAELRHCPRELWVIYSLKFLESYAYYTISYSLLLYLSNEFGFSDSEAGWIYGITGLLVSVYGFVVGFVIDNLGVRASLSLGFAINFVSRCIIAGTKSSRVITTVLFTSLPLGSALGIPVMSIGIRRYTTPKNRTVAFALFYVMMNLAAVVAAPAVDAFRQSMKTEIEYHGYAFTPYRLLIMSGCVMTLVALAVTLVFVREINVSSEDEDKAKAKEAEESGEASGEEVPRPPSRALEAAAHANEEEDGGMQGHATTYMPRRANPLEIARQVCADTRFWKFFGLVVILLGVRLVFRHLDATFPKYMIREFGPDVMFGTIIGINPFLIIIFVPLFSPFLSHIDPYTAMIYGTFISGVSPFFLVLGAKYWTAIAFVATLSVGEAIWSPRLYEYTVSIADEGREGTFMALGNVPTFVATLLAGGMSGYLLSTYCPPNPPRHSEIMWLIIGCISVLSPTLVCLLQGILRIEPHERETVQRADLRASQRKAASSRAKATRETIAREEEEQVGLLDGTDEVEEAEEIMDLPAGLIGSDPSSNEGADGGHEVTMEGRIN